MNLNIKVGFEAQQEKKNEGPKWSVIKSNHISKTKKTGGALAPDPVLWLADHVFLERGLLEVDT